MRRLILGAIGATLFVGPAGLATAEATAASGQPPAIHAKAASWPIVRAGAKGERVRVIQYLLNAQSFRVGIDGSYGKSTTAAVKLFQKAKRLTVDGHVGPSTWVKLTIRIKRGSRGDAVRALQHQLRFQYGYKSVTVDGSFGATTQAAVKNFQGKRKLRADGIVGTATWQALES